MRVNYSFAYANKKQFLQDKKKIINGFTINGFFLMGVSMAVPTIFQREVRQAEITSKQKIDMLLHFYYYEEDEDKRPSTN